MLKLDEYLAEMSRSDQQQVENRLVQALEHLLKIHSMEMPEVVHRNKRGWQESVDEQRRRLFRLISAHGSLKPHLRNVDLEAAYRKALKALDVEYPSVQFPRACPFTLEEIVGDAVMKALRKTD
jgi:Domain of unknown function DUF29